MRFLIVDHSARDREQLARLLTNGFSDAVVLAAGGREAYQEALAAAPVDFVLTEHALDWADGFTVLREVKSRWPDVPVIMVTGSGSETLAVDALKAGFSDYVPRAHVERLLPAVYHALTHSEIGEVLRVERQALSVELSAARRLQDVSVELVGTDRIDALYEQILEAAVAILHADFGSMQVYHPERGEAGELLLLSYRGFSERAAEFWTWVGPVSGSACSRALNTKQRVIVHDVETCDWIAGTEDLATYLQTGIRSVQTTPLLSRSGTFLGMLSTHWREPYEPTESELRSLDILARLSADLLERRRVEGALRDREAELQSHGAALEIERARLSALVNELTEAKAQVEDLARFPGENPNPILRVRADGTLLYANQASAPVLAQWPCEIGETVPELWRSMVDRALSAQEQLLLDVTILPHTYAFQIVPVRDAGYVNLYAHDITQRMRTQDELRRSQTDLARAQEVGQMGSWRLDARENVLTWSDETCCIFGLPLGTPLTYAAFLEFVHPDDRQSVDEQWQASVRGADYEAEHRIVVNGQVKWVREKAYLERDEAGDFVRGFGIAQDISERKRSEEALRESEARYRSLFYSMDEGFCIIEMLFDSEDRPIDYRFLEANPVFERQAGFEVTAGLRIREVAPNHEEHWFETYGRVAQTGEPVRFQNEAKVFGRYYDVYAFRVGQPEQRRVAVLFTDITAQRMAEDSLRRHAAELESANQANRILLQEVNHRVKNSLTAILGLIFAEQRRLTQYIDHLPGRYHCNIQGALANLSDRVTSLATVHTLLSANEWRPLRVDELVSAVIQAATSGWHESQDIDLEVTGSPLKITPEQAHHLALVVSELTTNTLKHGRRGERVRISVDIAQENGDVRLMYRNHGPEFPQTVLAGDGYSVGLNIVDKLATHSLRGTWTLYNEGGPVTEIRFPIEQVTQPEHTP